MILNYSLILDIDYLLKCLWQTLFYFLVRFYIRFWGEKRKKFPSSDFPSPRFSRLKTWNFTSGWVKNRVKRETGDSCVVTSHREHIDNQSEREVRDCGDDTRQQPRNPSLFLRQSSLSVNDKMSSFQAAVEFDSNQESSDSDLSETILVSNREIPVYVLFPGKSRQLCDAWQCIPVSTPLHLSELLVTALGCSKIWQDR